MAQLAPPIDENQLRRHFDALVRRGAFKPILRFLPVEVGEERLQDTVAQTWAAYRHYALDKGKLLPDAILVHYAKLRATDANRHFVGGRHRDCPLDWRNFRDGKVRILHLDGIPHDDDELPEEGDLALIGLAVAMSASPVRKLDSALDLERWLDGLDEEDREMLASRAAGYSLEETAATVGKCLSTVFTRTNRLGEELAARAGVDLHQRRPPTVIDRMVSAM